MSENNDTSITKESEREQAQAIIRLKAEVEKLQKVADEALTLAETRIREEREKMKLIVTQLMTTIDEQGREIEKLKKNKLKN